MAASSSDFFSAAETWLRSEPAVESAVLFGSSARVPEVRLQEGRGADADLHIVTPAPEQLERVEWGRAMPGQHFCLQVVRPATGGVTKVSVIFAGGGLDLVLVPAAKLREVRQAVSQGLHRERSDLRTALNEMATCLRTGYRFIKGEEVWGAFYAQVEKEMPGVRVGDEEARRLAEIFLCDLLWVVQKLGAGELLAAQHLLHRQLSETNLRLIRELRLRRNRPLPSFGLARRYETLLSIGELEVVRVDSRLERRELQNAAWRSFEGLKTLMKELVPGWVVPPDFERLLTAWRDRPV